MIRKQRRNGYLLRKRMLFLRRRQSDMREGIALPGWVKKAAKSSKVKVAFRRTKKAILSPAAERFIGGDKTTTREDMDSYYKKIGVLE